MQPDPGLRPTPPVETPPTMDAVPIKKKLKKMDAVPSSFLAILFPKITIPIVG